MMGRQSFDALFDGEHLQTSRSGTRCPVSGLAGMQYMHHMFSGRGRLYRLALQRHAQIEWTSVRRHLENNL